MIDTRLGAIPRATVEPPIVYSSTSPQPTIQATLQTLMQVLLTHVIELQVKITKRMNSMISCSLPPLLECLQFKTESKTLEPLVATNHTRTSCKP